MHAKGLCNRLKDEAVVDCELEVNDVGIHPYIQQGRDIQEQLACCRRVYLQKYLEVVGTDRTD